MGPSVPYHVWKDTKDPIPPPDKLPQLVPPTFSPPASCTEEERTAWYADLKATWLGHACFLVEFPASPAPTGTEAGAGAGGADAAERRGFRVLFDPVWSHRCSPSQYIGPARVTQPPIPLQDIPPVDAVVISHNHYDHLDVTTLKHLHGAQPPGSVHFFVPLGNARWMREVIGVQEGEVTELDWWGERKLRRSVQGPESERKEVGGEVGHEGEAAADPSLRVVCTPCQHRNDTLWASWAVESSTGGKVYFGGDTGLRSVAKGTPFSAEQSGPTCPAFAEIGRRLGPFDLGMIPIGAYQPRWIMSPVHCSPEDSVRLHQDVRSKRSIGMHWGTWRLTSEEMTEPPRRLRAACDEAGIPEGQFGVTDIGETVRIKLSE
ncbi:Protein-lysine N-methyltransferase efm4 [Rhodotorula sphaerocarpa]